MRSHLSYRAKRELFCQIAPRYREASSALKEVILDEFVAATGYARKYAIRLLNHPVDLKLTIASTSAPLRTSSPTGALPGMDCHESHLRQTPDSLSPHPHRSTGAA